MPDYRFQYDFHPVGQGLFAAGHLMNCLADDQHHSTRTPNFTWVYDCGTSSEQSLLTKAIHHYGKNTNSSKQIDLVAISHFDNDHISGLLTLLEHFDVKTLLLPYMPLWQRLIIAFQEGVDSQQERMQFFINPVAYIVRQEGINIERIIFVGSSFEEELPTETSILPESNDESWVVHFETPPPPDEGNQADDREAFEKNARGTSIAFIRNGSPLRIMQGWEFIPYNDAEVNPNLNSRYSSLVEFQNSVSNLKQQLLFGDTPEMALKEIKDAYDDYFGASSPKRNIISLFLYAGPIPPLDTKALICHFNAKGNWFSKRKGFRRCSVLYTGDGYLNTPDRLNRLAHHLRGRMARVSCFQVMHHGAKGNWYPGLGDAIQPDFSIFSSDPSHKQLQHPHPPVLRDFWLHGPVQVDKAHGAYVRGYVKKLPSITPAPFWF